MHHRHLCHVSHVHVLDSSNTRQARSAVGRFRIAVTLRSNRGINQRGVRSCTQGLRYFPRAQCRSGFEISRKCYEHQTGSAASVSSRFWAHTTSCRLLVRGKSAPKRRGWRSAVAQHCTAYSFELATPPGFGECLVFWVLAGACQRHGVGGFLLCNTTTTTGFGECAGPCVVVV